MRVVSVAAVALVLAASSTAVATPQPKPPTPAPACGLADEAGDVAGHLGSSALDILSAESAAGRTELVVVLRVPTTDTSDDTVRKLDRYEWSVRFGADGIDYSFGYRISGLVNERRESAVTVGTVTPPHVIQVTPHEILWRVKRSDLPPAPRARSAWVDIEVSTHNVEGTADTATGRVRRAGCRLP